MERFKKFVEKVKKLIEDIKNSIVVTVLKKFFGKAKVFVSDHIIEIVIGAFVVSAIKFVELLMACSYLQGGADASKYYTALAMQSYDNMIFKLSSENMAADKEVTND